MLEVLKYRFLDRIKRLLICSVFGSLAVAYPLSGYSDITVYSETYRDFFSSRTIQFQRLRFGQEVGSVLGKPFVLYGSAIHEKYDTKNLASLEGGAEYVFAKYWRAMVAVRWLNLNYDPAEDSQVRVGVLGGNFLELISPWLIFEDYAEAFLLVPGKSDAQFAGSASARLAFRAFSKFYWILDPLVLEFRGYRASNPEYAGRSYVAGNLGPRVTYWWPSESGAGSASLYLARSIVWTKHQKADFDNWFLFTIGAAF